MTVRLKPNEVEHVIAALERAADQLRLRERRELGYRIDSGQVQAWYEIAKRLRADSGQNPLDNLTTSCHSLDTELANRLEHDEAFRAKYLKVLIDSLRLRSVLEP